MPCLGRYTTVKHQLKFGDGKHRFWIELCCGNACEGELCMKCCIKSQKKTQDSRTFDHGLVTGAYPKESHLFDSPWYHESVKKYGEPKATDLDIAMEAQRKARGGKEVVMVTQSEPSQTAEEPAKPKRGGRKKADEVKEVNEKKVKEPKVKEPKVKEPKEPKAKAPRKSKKTIAPEVVTPPPVVEAPPLTQIPADTKFIETTDDPIRLDTVIRILLKPFTHGSHSYWRDAEREKLYKRLSDGKRGDYVGRWDSDTQTIDHDAPDSDEE
jgi:hypothetical protein